MDGHLQALQPLPMNQYARIRLLDLDAEPLQAMERRLRVIGSGISDDLGRAVAQRGKDRRAMGYGLVRREVYATRQRGGFANGFDHASRKNGKLPRTYGAAEVRLPGALLPHTESEPRSGALVGA